METSPEGLPPSRPRWREAIYTVIIEAVVWTLVPFGYTVEWLKRRRLAFR